MCNTGTLEERGIAAWHVFEADEERVIDRSRFDEGYEVYEPPIPRRFLYSRVMRYLPFMPYRRGDVNNELGEVKVS